MGKYKEMNYAFYVKVVKCEKHDEGYHVSLEVEGSSNHLGFVASKPLSVGAKFLLPLIPYSGGKNDDA